MKTRIHGKSSTDEIRERFDSDVERFSNLETGQVATMDAPLALELVSLAAVRATPKISRILDVGCGAGNNAIKLLRTYGKGFACDLCDLSRPMLERAKERIASETEAPIRTYEGDFRSIAFEESGYDAVVAAAVFHHLRDDKDWEETFAKAFRLLRKGGSLWISDLVAHEAGAIDDMMRVRYKQYLEGVGGAAYAKKVLAYIDKEDSPRPVTYQTELMRRVGFREIDVLFKNTCFAAFGGIK